MEPEIQMDAAEALKCEYNTKTLHLRDQALSVNDSTERIVVAVE